MAVRIVSLTAKLGLDGTQFQQNLRKAGQQVDGWARSVRGQFGAVFGAAGIIAGFRKIASEVDRIKDASEQFSVTTDEVQKLGVAAEMSGQTFDQLGAAMERLGAARKDAAEGNEEMRAQFARFGISLEALNDPAQRNIDLMQEMAKAIRGMNLTAADSQALRELFGKSGARLAAVFADLANVKIDLITPETIEAIDKTNRSLDVLKQKATAAFANELGDMASGKSTVLARLKARFGFGPSANNPQSRSAEMVGPGMAQGPLFEDKAKQKEAARRAIEAAKEHERALMEKVREIMSNLPSMERGRDNFLSGMNAAPGGISAERGFALLGGSEAKKTEENTRRTVEAVVRATDVLNMIHKNILGGDGLNF